MRTTLRIFAIFISFAMITSCVSKKKYMQLEDEKANALSELREAKSQISDLEDTNMRLKNELDKVKKDLNMQIADLTAKVEKYEQDVKMKEAELQQRNAKITQLNSEISNALNKNSGIAMSERDGSLYLVMDNNILYSSGSARINKEGREVIKNVAEVIKNHPDVGILVESHTDHKKMVEGAIYADNWDLSARRSNNVVRHLVKNGVEASQVGASSRAEYKPIHEGDDLTADQLKENRRTEFMILPNLTGLYNM
jgi:chemotaxis protein MotB